MTAAQPSLLLPHPDTNTVSPLRTYCAMNSLRAAYRWYQSKSSDSLRLQKRRHGLSGGSLMQERRRAPTFDIWPPNNL